MTFNLSSALIILYIIHSIHLPKKKKNTVLTLIVCVHVSYINMITKIYDGYFYMYIYVNVIIPVKFSKKISILYSFIYIWHVILNMFDSPKKEKKSKKIIGPGGMLENFNDKKKKIQSTHAHIHTQHTHTHGNMYCVWKIYIFQVKIMVDFLLCT